MKDKVAVDSAPCWSLVISCIIKILVIGRCHFSPFFFSFSFHFFSRFLVPFSEMSRKLLFLSRVHFNPLKPELNPICYLLALLGAHHFLHISRIRVKLLTLG